MKTESVKKKYNWYSKIYDRFEAPMEEMIFQDLRKQIIGSLKGLILEIGVGTGKNLPYYHSQAHVIGIDISPGMLARANQKVSTFQGKELQLRLMNGEHLDFRDNSFDNIICTFVLCSVSDPIRAIEEMLRVLKKEGRLILLEHVLSKMPLIALGQKLLNPFIRGIFGFNIDRDTISNVKKNKTVILKDQNLTKTDILKFIVCKKPILKNQSQKSQILTLKAG
ncbi:MAG: class I SAM-dependent methyltransferase [Candidatus Hodarchaeota archaeon]